MRAFSRLVPVLVVLGTVTAISAAPDDGATAPSTGSGSAIVAQPLSDAEMQVRSKALSVQLKDDYRHVIAMKERAEKQKDVVKVTCVNDKLVQIKVQMNIADSTSSQLQLSIEKNAADKATVFSSLTSTGDDVRRLREEAVACLGEPELFKQESGLEVQKPEITDDPTATDPYNPGGIVEVEPPGYASPFH